MNCFNRHASFFSTFNNFFCSVGELFLHLMSGLSLFIESIFLLSHVELDILSYQSGFTPQLVTPSCLNAMRF